MISDLFECRAPESSAELRAITGWFLVGNEGMRYPISPYIYPLSDGIGYLIPPHSLLRTRVIRGV